MIFDSNDAGTGIDEARREMPLRDRIAAAAPSPALTAGGDVA
ncbi:hypothetical protein [Microbacterium sp. SSM24]|nr:hypothetical protein [Microbacterium sp. SSM24]MCW3493600.1 hypothetical protein [Microbacterium sp. SSM24]